jgi:hypothetical protein
MVFVKLFAVTGLILVVYWALREFPADEMALFREVIRGWTGTSRTADNTEAGAPPEAPLPSERNVRRGTLAP